MIQQEIHIRENKQYTLNHGTNEEGKSQIWVDVTDVHASTGQPIRFSPKNIFIDTDDPECKGTLLAIKTVWKQVLVGNSGQPIPDTESKKPPLTSNKIDTQDFDAMFGDAIRKFMANGFVRKILGHNYQRLFDAAGARIPDANYDTTLPPTNDYQTHDIDGTPIS